MDDLRFVHSLYGLHAPIKFTEFKVHPAAFLACVIGAFIFTVFHVADILDPWSIRDDFDHCGPKLVS